MPRIDFTDATIILDRSGSMSSIREATIQSINTFIGDQMKVPGKIAWSLIQFDGHYEVHFEARQQGVPRLTRETYVPRGNTALIDAVCRAIDDTGTRLAGMPEAERPGKVLVVIMTDGYENASTRFTRKDMAERIAHQRDKYNWQVVYLGANQDAVAEAAKYGIARDAAATYNASAIGTMACSTNFGGVLREWRANNSVGAAIDIGDAVKKRIADNIPLVDTTSSAKVAP